MELFYTYLFLFECVLAHSNQRWLMFYINIIYYFYYCNFRLYRDGGRENQIVYNVRMRLCTYI